MWRKALVPVLLLASMAVAADELKPFSVFARSQHYSLNVDVVPLAGGAFNYNVTVVDLATNAVVAQPQLSTTSAPKPAFFETDAGALHFRIVTAQGGNAELFTASLEVSKGDMVIDSISMRSTIAPHRRVVGGVVGGVVPRADLPPDTYRVGGEVKAPIVISRVEPLYPEEARRARISGIVIVEALIDKTGAVRQVQVLKPLPYGLDQAAVDAVNQWRFQPGTKDGQPVNVIFNLTVNFKIDTPPPRKADS